VVEPEDEAFFIAASENIRAVTSELRKLDEPYKRVMIAGGGKIGASLAKRLERDYQVKVLELNYNRCRVLSEELEESIVLNGSANDSKLLLQENISNTDVFCALTNNGESNIMMSMLAKRLGCEEGHYLNYQLCLCRAGGSGNRHCDITATDNHQQLADSCSQGRYQYGPLAEAGRR
jgi:trk system potassium uptake protein TrkA